MELSQLAFSDTIRAKPVLKWAGGKGQLLSVLLARVPKGYKRYIEPFFGGGALFFALRPDAAVISDSNPDLINLYRTLAWRCEDVIEHLRHLSTDENTYYEIRALDANQLDPISRAARTIYLNRTCFNGLYRVNRHGQFNVPFGKYTNPQVCDESNLRAASFALSRAEIVLGDFETVLDSHARPGDLVFMDPPYIPASKYSDFKRYTSEQFREDDHRRLAARARRLCDNGCYVVITNSNTPLVRELFSDFDIEVHVTRRNINKVATSRTGEDVIIIGQPRKQFAAVPSTCPLPSQALRYPPTRFMGSKQELLGQLWSIASRFEFDSVLDLFSGSGVVSYMFKAQGKRVISNDYMAFSAMFAKALVQNSSVTLTQRDIGKLLDKSTPSDHFVSDTFAGLYFDEADNAVIDTIRSNIPRLRTQAGQALGYAALVRACMKRRPRGIFTYVGQRYDDGRRDLKLTLEEHFCEAVRQFNEAVFDNGRRNVAVHGDALMLERRADLVYLDPPYFSPLSDNEYVRRYHFVEGLVRNWQGVEIQKHTKTRKFKSYPTPFGTRDGAMSAFDSLFRKHRNSVLLISYSSNSLPTMDELLALLTNHKRHVEVFSIDHRYSFGNQGHKAGNSNNRVQEYLFAGY